MISIIIPCYNAAMTIAQCLDSILAQNHQHYRVICINDGSTDETLEILWKYETKDPRITVITQLNGGLSSARNTGLANVSDQWVMFVDADDWLKNDCLESVLKYGREDLVCFSYDRVFAKRIQPRKLNLNGSYTAEFIQRRIVGLVGDELHDPTQADSLVTAWGKIYKHRIIRDHHISFTDTKNIGTEDALFNIEYLEHAKNVFVLDEPLYNYSKIDSNSLTQMHKQDLLSKWKNLYSRIAHIIDRKDPIFKTALQNRICLGIIGVGLNETFARTSFRHKYVRMNCILSDELYSEPFKNLTFQYFPIHWKLFFMFAKYRLTMPLLILLFIIKNRIGDAKN